MHQLIWAGICTHAEYTKSTLCAKGAKRRNEFWKSLGYPNLVRARARRRKNTRAGGG